MNKKTGRKETGSRLFFLAERSPVYLHFEILPDIELKNESLQAVERYGHFETNF